MVQTYFTHSLFLIYLDFAKITHSSYSPLRSLFRLIVFEKKNSVVDLADLSIWHHTIWFQCTTLLRAGEATLRALKVLRGC